MVNVVDVGIESHEIFTMTRVTRLTLIQRVLQLIRVNLHVDTGTSTAAAV